MWKIEKSWHAALIDELKKPYIQELKAFVASEKLFGKEVFPPEEEIFSAFLLTPFDKVKVVIVGQDPYHGPGQAHGLSFSVKKGVNTPPSLKNIYKELAQDVGFKPVTHGLLTPWAKQGVLLLNATLTVNKGSPKSHFGKGWERLTDHICKTLLEKREHLVFLLWGRSAKEKIFSIENFDQRCKKHLVLQAAHPSPFSAHSGFFGCRHFSKANNYLAKWGKSLVDWQL